MSETREVVNLTKEQRAEVLELLKGYFGDDRARQQAQDAAKAMVEDRLEQGIKARLAVMMQADPAKLIAELFRSSGHVVQTQASKEFDAIIAAVVKDEDSGIPGAIRLHVQEHLPELIQRAITQVISAMVIDWLKSGVGGMTDATLQIIRQTLQNFNIVPRY